jgi:putative nucleotidyltransferase with HDIG domain
MAVTVGIVPALIVDILAAIVGSALFNQAHKPKSGSFWIAMNASIAAVSAAVGALGMTVVALTLREHRAFELLSVLVFLVCHSIVNLACIALLKSVNGQGDWFRNVVAGAETSGWHYAFYAVVACAVVELVAVDLVWLVPIMVVPILAVRSGLRQRNLRDDHYEETVSTLTQMLQRAHPYTVGHLERVADIAEEVARHVGVPARRARLVRQAAVLHDIGKIAVDERVLDKPAKLNDAEMAHVRRHPEWGAEILSPVSQFREIVPWILHHHERPDGCGYPHRLQGESIPIESKIIAVVDAFDAMVGSEGPGGARSYREPMTTQQALEELDRCSGTQFDCSVVQAFREVVARKPL